MVQPIEHSDFTKDDRSKVLEAVNLIKEKRKSIMKGWRCANRSKQMIYLKEGKDTLSPTVSLAAVITNLLIDA